MSHRILLAARGGDAEAHLPAAGAAIDWALSTLSAMTSDGGGLWRDRSPTLGYVERAVDAEGVETLRIRPDSTSTDDDVVLVEPPLIDGPPHLEDGIDPETLAASLKRWREALERCVPDDGTHAERSAALVARAAASHMGPGIAFAVSPPSAHVHATIVTLGPAGAAFDEAESDLIATAQTAVGAVAWLRTTAGAGLRTWEYPAPPERAFRSGGGNDDPMRALRAHAALASGITTDA